MPTGNAIRSIQRIGSARSGTAQFIIEERQRAVGLGKYRVRLLRQGGD